LVNCYFHDLKIVVREMGRRKGKEGEGGRGEGKRKDRGEGKEGGEG
jgi:hypothetical protein